MDKGINQENTPDDRPNLRCHDGTLFVFIQASGHYEPYIQGQNANPTTSHGVAKPRSFFPVEVKRDRFVFGVTTLLSILTLIVVAYYTYFAAMQACAAVHAVTQATKSMRLDERAWVAVTTIDRPKEKGGCQWRVMRFRNSGRSAALGFEVYATAESVPVGSFPSRPEPHIPGKGIIAPASEFDSCIGDRGIDQSDWSKTDLVVHGKVTYNDVFNVSHWTKFCLIRRKENAFTSCESGNEMDGNGIDD